MNYDEWKLKDSDREEPEPVKYCDLCGKPIYFGDYYYDMGIETWCEDCIKERRNICG